MPTCDKCGREFDTERGLKVHAAQMHADDDGDDQHRETVTKEASAGNVTLRLSVTHALLLTFVVGIFVGGFFMATIGAVSGPTGALAQGNDVAPTGNNQPSGDNNPQPSGNQNPTQGAVDPSQIALDGEPTMGSADAPVTVVVYEDFECPFCQRFEQGAMPQIVSNYVDSGEVKVVWKDFPLTQIHPWAEPAAVAMECVYRQNEDAFWALKDQIFNNQNTLSAGNAQDRIIQWAADEGVSGSAVQSCIDSGDAQSEVQSDASEGRNLGVSGTPTVFINGKKVVGAQPFSAFQSVIDSELNG